jgi:hypothetical protein
MGFGGLEISARGIVQVQSSLPVNWKSLKISGVGMNKRTYTINQKN